MKVSATHATAAALMLLPSLAIAATVIYPHQTPREEKHTEAPSWLSKGKGHDGYVSVTAKISAASVCDRINKPPMLGVLFSEKVQSVVTLRVAGFNSSVDDLSFPVATFNGTGEANDCYGLARLPVTMVQYARFPRTGPGALGPIDIHLNVHTTVDETSNIIPAAVAFTEVATVFASGPAAGALTTISSTLANPVLSKLEAGLNASLGNKTKAISAYSSSWSRMRGGLSTLTFPIHIGATQWNGFSQESPSQAIDRLQTAGKGAAGSKLVDVVLTFTYTKSIFDQSVSGEDDLPSGSMIGRQRVLNRGLAGQTFIQILNAGSPSLQQEVSAADGPPKLRAACQKIDDVLEKAGLAAADRIIVKKAFVDEATGGEAWYGQKTITACFTADEIATVMKIYGDGTANLPPVVGVQAGNGELHSKWLRNVAPVAVDLGSALVLASARDRTLISVLKGDVSDFVDFGWATELQPPESDVSARAFHTKYPEIWRVATRRAAAVSCLSYFSTAQLEQSPDIFHMVLLDADGKRWQLKGRVSANGGAPRIASLDIRPLVDGWKGIWAGYFDNDNECLEALGRPKAVYAKQAG
ncbi:hypothetical protein ACIGHN_10745 [Acidovorax sp. NPDC077693]|uniref:hypothetical protein n=1 Tax=unclassified Acidovorax TaxID=2684926 RepID=UPI0037C5B913